MIKFSTKKWNTILLVLSALFVLASCDKSSENKNNNTNVPKIIQSEQILDNPITLAFSWEAMNNATEYIYKLEVVKDSGNEEIAKGKTTNLNIEIASTQNAELLYMTKYRFTLNAVFSDESKLSETAEVYLTTNSGAISLYIENLTYRSALMKSEPKDKDMYYQFAQVPLEKLESYESDMAFIEDYDFGYYKALSKQYSIPWYQVMQEFSIKGNSEYETRMLKPEHTYVFYTYGVEFDYSTTENPVKVITPMIKNIFTTPKWKATSEGTFQIKIENQELVNIGNDYIANINVKVIPSNPTERYYVAFAEKKQLKEQYNDDIYDFAFDIIYSEELYSSVDDWSTTKFLSSGEKVIASKDFGWGLYTGADYKILVFGVDGKGLVTTEIATLDCTTIGNPSGTTAAGMKGIAPKETSAVKAADRL